MKKKLILFFKIGFAAGNKLTAEMFAEIFANG